MDRRREPLPTRVQDPHRSPPRTTTPSAPACATWGSTCDGRARGIDGHVRLLLAWTPAINLTAIREPAAVATRSTSSTA